MAAWGLGGALVLGFVAGLRTFTPLAALFLVRGGWLGIVFGLCALGEYAGDMLPGIPSRTSPPALGARMVSGAIAGWLFGRKRCRSAGRRVARDRGSDRGAFGGRAVRTIAIERIGAIPAALIEDVVAIGLAVYVVTRPG